MFRRYWPGAARHGRQLLEFLRDKKPRCSLLERRLGKETTASSFRFPFIHQDFGFLCSWNTTTRTPKPETPEPRYRQGESSALASSACTLGGNTDWSPSSGTRYDASTSSVSYKWNRSIAAVSPSDQRVRLKLNAHGAPDQRTG